MSLKENNTINEMMMESEEEMEGVEKVICPYCNREAKWVENKRIYRRNMGTSYMIYLCEDCDAYVGCHKNTTEPLGTLANKELRELRKKAHRLFDPIWQKKKMFKGMPVKGRRQKAYEYLEEKTGVKHIAQSNEEDCIKIVELLKDK